MNGWGWVIAGYLLAAAVWIVYWVWTRPGRTR